MQIRSERKKQKRKQIQGTKFRPPCHEFCHQIILGNLHFSPEYSGIRYFLYCSLSVQIYYESPA